MLSSPNQGSLLKPLAQTMAMEASSKAGETSRPSQTGSDDSYGLGELIQLQAQLREAMNQQDSATERSSRESQAAVEARPSFQAAQDVLGADFKTPSRSEVASEQQEVAATESLYSSNSEFEAS